MKHKQVRVMVELDGELQFSRFQGESGKCGLQSLDVDVLLAANEALENTLLEIKKLIPASGLAQEENLSNIEVKFGDFVAFSYTMPVASTPSGITTKDVPTNLKVKEVLERALGIVNINLKSNS